MTTDYDLPPEWENMDSDERDVWFKQERARRQAMQQKTPFKRRLEKMIERHNRKMNARSEIIDLSDMQ